MTRLRHRLRRFRAGAREHGWGRWILYCALRGSGVVRLARKRLRTHVPLLHCYGRKVILTSRHGGLVSVVVPTYNGVGDGLENLLVSIRAQTYRDVEIVAIDSTSTDDTSAMLERYGARVSVIPQVEFHHSRTRNLGASLAAGKYVLFTVQDAAFKDPRWIENGVAALDRFKAVSYSTPQVPRTGASLLARYLARNFVKNLYPSGISVIGGGPASAMWWRALTLRGIREEFLHIDDTNHLVRKNFFDSVGGFEGLTCEDMGFAWKVLKAHQKFVYSTLSSIEHSHDYRDVVKYSRRVFVDNRAIGQIVQDARGGMGGAYALDSVLLIGGILLSIFFDVARTCETQGYTRVSFVSVTNPLAGTVHFSDLERAFALRVRSAMIPPNDSQLGAFRFNERVVEIFEALGISLAEVRTTGEWRRWLRLMHEVADAARAHVFNATRIVEELTQTDVESLAEVTHFGSAIILNTVMFWASRLVQRYSTAQSGAAPALSALTWA